MVGSFTTASLEQFHLSTIWVRYHYMTNRTRFSLYSSFVVAILLLVLAPATAGGQTNDREAEVGPAATTPIGVPFVGSFEMWCTSGNPAPGNLCGNHHSTPAIDFGMDPGTPINATGDGIVSEIETSCVGFGFCRNGAGNFIAILHADGRFSRYLHLTDVFVEEGQLIQLGDVIGTTGVTGQTSSPHLHYDEQFPRGTRVQMGTWIGCVDGEQVLYPQSLGHTEWENVPFGTIIRNDDYSCLGNLAAATPPAETSPPAPIVASGEDVFAVAAPIVESTKQFDAEITEGDDVTVVSVSSTAFTILDEPARPVEIRLRLDSSAPWSDPVTYDPSSVPASPTCAGLHATSGNQGTRGPDVIIGTSLADQIFGEQGDDFICAGDGDDTIFGGRGADLILGEAGDDNIRGGIGRDTIEAGTGDDQLRGGNGIDLLLGQRGDDFILGGNGGDDIRGGDGDDELDGRNGSDTIRGGSGNDALIGHRADDELIGGAGADTFDGGDGTDTCDVRAADTATPVGCER